MRSSVRWVGIVGVAAIGVLAPVYVPQALADVDAFRATDIQVVGLGFVSAEEVRSLAGIDGSTSVWTSLDELALRIEEHPLVLSATVERDLPDRLRIRIEERVPVGFVATPTLEPVDRDGRYLPIDPAKWTLDLPLLSPRPDAAAGEGRPTPARLRLLAGLAEAAREEWVFWSNVSEIRETPSGDVVARWGTPEVVFQLGRSTEVHRLQYGVSALAEAMGEWPDRTPVAVDLRWADQVVVRYDS